MLEEKSGIIKDGHHLEGERVIILREFLRGKGELWYVVKLRDGCEYRIRKSYLIIEKP